VQEGTHPAFGFPLPSFKEEITNRDEIYGRSPDRLSKKFRVKIK
jgi:hypothetical protein